MKRIWDFSKRDGGGGAPGSAATGTLAPPPPAGQPMPPAPGQVPPGPGPMVPGPMGPEPDGYAPEGDDMPERYLARPIRPVAQLAVRVGLWGAVILGCLGGIRALVFPGGSSEEPVVQDVGDAEIMLPATVAGVAEEIVQAWFTATPDDQEVLDRLFVEPPNAQEIDNENITLVDMRTVAGERVEDGYWTVTVAVDLIETDPDAPPPSDDEVGEEDEAPAVTSWYVEVGIVGEVWGRLAALATPAVVPAPPSAETTWEPDVGERYQPQDDDELGQAVEGFLTALLAGDGEVSRYLSPDSEDYRNGVPIRAANPAPFAGVEVLEIAWIELNEDDIRTWAQVRVTTAAGSSRIVAYEVVVRERRDRYEVLTVFGSPTVRTIPEDEEADTVDSDGSSTTTAEDEAAEEETSDTSTEDGSAGGSEPEGSPPPEEDGQGSTDSTDSTDTTIQLPAE